MDKIYILLNEFRLNLIKDIRLEYPKPISTKRINKINSELMPILDKLRINKKK